MPNPAKFFSSFYQFRFDFGPFRYVACELCFTRMGKHLCYSIITENACCVVSIQWMNQPYIY